MIKHYCDRCGEEIIKSVNIVKEPKWKTSFICEYNTVNGLVKYEMCRKCTDFAKELANAFFTMDKEWVLTRRINSERTE